ncbi:MAG: DNA polymerase IV [Bacteriovoracaceae bacterium]|nr:DNA polymerase IV [Bacteriovoracaceae bacterium]
MELKRKIIHFDMDYFYAQVEERDNPALKNLPVGIGGGKRGVLCTSNYVARKYGVKSAMPTFMALNKCPDLVLVRPNFQKYKDASAKIFEVFHEFTDKVEGLSLDEAYLDVTECSKHNNSATLIAKEIKQKIFERTGLTGSAGVSYNKLLAKISSDLNKPNGLFTLGPHGHDEVIKSFPVTKIWGVGAKTAKKMKSLGIVSFGDLQTFSKLELEEHFGSFGPSLYLYSRGIDFREVKTERERKSLSVENTFFEDIDDYQRLEGYLEKVVEEMTARLERHKDRAFKTIYVKLKHSDFTQTTIEEPYESLDIEKFKNLFRRRFNERRAPLRLIGAGVKFHSDARFSKQLILPCCG